MRSSTQWRRWFCSKDTLKIFKFLWEVELFVELINANPEILQVLNTLECACPHWNRILAQGEGIAEYFWLLHNWFTEEGTFRSHRNHKNVMSKAVIQFEPSWTSNLIPPVSEHLTKVLSAWLMKETQVM